MRVAKDQKIRPAYSQIDEPIPFTITPEGLRLLQVWRLTRWLKMFPRSARN